MSHGYLVNKIDVRFAPAATRCSIRGCGAIALIEGEEGDLCMKCWEEIAALKAMHGPELKRRRPQALRGRMAFFSLLALFAFVMAMLIFFVVEVGAVFMEWVELYWS